jgi:hypothetical protein
MTFYIYQAKQVSQGPEVHLTQIHRSAAPALNDVEQAIEADRCWFAGHPEADEYIREFVPGEFGAAGLPLIPSGFRYATLVTVIHGRRRRWTLSANDRCC